MTRRPDTPGAHAFWALAEEILTDAAVEEGTMMGMACLRRDGDFLASYFRRDDAMIARVGEVAATALIESGVGNPFAPAQKVFKGWVAVPFDRASHWRAVLRGALGPE